MNKTGYGDLAQNKREILFLANFGAYFLLRAENI
jgi:hypothetical protein